MAFFFLPAYVDGHGWSGLAMDLKTERGLSAEEALLPERVSGSSGVASGEAQLGQCEAAQRLRALIDRAPEAMLMLDVETGRFIDSNPAAEQLFGLPRDRLHEMGPFELSPADQPDGSSLELGREKIAEAVRGGAAVFEWWHRNARGERIPCEVRLVLMPWGDRNVVRGSIVDVTGRKLLQLSELGRRRILDHIRSGASLSETMASLVRTIEDLLPGMICSILLLDDQNCLGLGAAPSLPDFYNSAIDGLKIGPTVGSCGAAAFTGRRVVARDVRSHANWAEFRQLAERAGVKACWSEPVFAPSGGVLGTFAMYYGEPTDPAPVEIQAIEIAAQLTSIIIEHDRSRRALEGMNETLARRVAEETKHLAEANQMLRAAEEDARLAAIAFDTHDSILITDKHGTILRVNRSFTEMTGYTPEEAIGKSPRILKSGRHGEEFYRDMWRAIRTVGYWEGNIWNRRKNGQPYLQRLTIASVKDESGKTSHYVGDGQDVTAVELAKADRAAIEAARRVQRTLFPKQPPHIPGFDIAAAVHPAERVSGDFFDYIPLGEQSLGVLVADISGHGLGPALLMAQTQAYLHALAESHSDPIALLKQVNRLFTQGDSGHFLTMFLGCLDPATRSFVYAGAGHQAYTISSDSATQVLKSTSIPLGVEKTIAIRSAPPVVLFPGSTLVVPTDGIEEATSPDGSVFGRERMLNVVWSNRAKSAAQIIDALFSAARDFAEDEPQKDDITALVIKALPTACAETSAQPSVC